MSLQHAHLDYLRMMRAGPIEVKTVREHVFGPDYFNAYVDCLRIEDDLIRQGLARFECWRQNPRCFITAEGDRAITVSFGDAE